MVVDAVTDFEAEKVTDTVAEEVADTEAEAEEVAGHIAHRRNLCSQPKFLKQLDVGP